MCQWRAIKLIASSEGLEMIDMGDGPGTAPPFIYTLTDDQIKTIGLITLNWGNAETLIAFCALPRHMTERENENSISYPRTPSRDELMRASLGQSIKRLRSMISRGEFPVVASAVIDQLDSANKTLKPYRNALCHGITFKDIIANPDGTEISSGDLDKALKHSNYVGMLAVALMAISVRKDLSRADAKPLGYLDVAG